MTDNTPIYLTFGAGNVLRGPLLTLWARCFGGSYLQSGGVVSEQSTPAMAVDVAALTGYLAGVAASDPGDAVEIEASDDTYDRIDLIYLDSIGLKVAKGMIDDIAPAEEADWKKWTAPSPALLDSAEAIIPLAEIHVAAGATAIYEADIRMMACPVIYPAASAHNHLKGSWALDTVVLIGDWYQNDGGTYEALANHTATADDEPGAGVNWETYWRIVAQGIPGTNGADGAAAPTILFGTVAPTTEGSDGDIYFQNDGELVTLWGPKVEGAWPVEGTLLTVAGADGADGAAGADGTLLQTEYGVTTPMIVLEQRTAPDEPAEGYVCIYGKADGLVYFLANGGYEKCLSPPPYKNYCPNPSFSDWVTLGAITVPQQWNFIGGNVAAPDADDPTIEQVSGSRDGYGDEYACQITSGGSGHEGLTVTLYDLLPATRYYVRMWMQAEPDSTAQAWTTGASNNLNMLSISEDGEWVAGEFTTDTTPTDIVFCIGQLEHGDIATYDKITISEMPSPGFFQNDHNLTHYTGFRDQLEMSRLYNDGSDFLTQYAALDGRSGGQVLIGGTGASETLQLRSTSHATKGKILIGSLSAYDEVNGRLGIGVTDPTAPIELTPTMTITRQDDTAYGASLSVTKSRGSRSSPTAAQSGDELGYIIARGYGTSAYLTGGHILFRAAENFGSNCGTNLSFSITAVGASSPTERMRLFASGGLTLGSTSDPGAGNFYASGNVSALSFTDRTKAFSGDALAAIEKIKANAKGEIDHASLPEFALDTYQDEKGEWQPGRSIGDMLSVVVAWAQQYRAATDARIAALEKTIADMAKKNK